MSRPPSRSQLETGIPWLDCRSVVLLVAIGTLVSGSLPAQAQPATRPLDAKTHPGEPAYNAAPEDESALSPRHASRHHFESGIRLFEDKNYSGALAEFEAAYRTFPSASALQNVALCQKQLYRYSDARKTLTQLLESHGSELSVRDREEVRDATTELLSLVGTVRFNVTPPNATLVLDGRTLGPQDLSEAISLDVGEHHVVAEADGFAPLTQVFRVAGGHTDVPVDLALTETTGIVEILAPDPQTAIAIDGRPVAFEFYQGRLAPGRHFVQVYREGYEPYEEELDITVGEKARVVGELGESLFAEAQNGDSTTSTTKRSQLGWYGLGSASLLAVRGHPAGFRADSNYDFGYELGFRAGYRVLPPIAFEGQVASGSYVVQGHCANVLPSSCPYASTAEYRFDTRRIGANVRLMSQGEPARFVSSIGTGAVSQDFEIGTSQAKGVSPYVQLELGVAMNYRHLLCEVSALGIFDGASSIRQVEFRPFEMGGGMQFFGLSIRLGYSEWSVSRKTPPMPQAPSAHGQSTSLSHQQLTPPLSLARSPGPPPAAPLLPPPVSAPYSK